MTSSFESLSLTKQKRKGDKTYVVRARTEFDERVVGLVPLVDDNERLSTEGAAPFAVQPIFFFLSFFLLDIDLCVNVR